MLFELLRLIEASTGPVTVAQLQLRLGVDESTLNGMLDFWVRKGRLHLDGRSDAVCGTNCVEAACSCGSCEGAEGCPFVARLPRAYELSLSQVTRADTQ